MSEHLHPGLHPDPDSLNAFIEGVLPEHARLQCLAHLAECSRCREIIFLAQEPPPVPAAANPSPAWRRWFAPVPVLAAAAAACIAVLAISLYLHHTAATPARDMVARVTPAPPVPTPLSAGLRPDAVAPPPVTPKDQPRTSRGPDRAVRRAATDPNSPGASNPTAIPPASRRTVTAAAAPPTLPPPPAIQVSAQSELIQNQSPPALLPSLPPPAAPPSVSIKDDRASADGLSGISGTITDASGAAVPGAGITLRRPSGTFSRDARTDMAGQFRLTGLPAGRYELQIDAPGFRRTLRQVELRPLELAAVSSVLEVGSVSESVEVTASNSTIQTEAASMARAEKRRKAISLPEPRPLPSKLSATITVTSGKVMLAVDTDGALFLSRNAGKSWKAVKPAWPGKVVDLITLAESLQTPAALFQLTTDSDSAWLSRDGNHWYPAPTRR
jgi:hypothetical protein